jgi:hypothetical protein
LDGDARGVSRTQIREAGYATRASSARTKSSQRLFLVVLFASRRIDGLSVRQTASFNAFLSARIDPLTQCRAKTQLDLNRKPTSTYYNGLSDGRLKFDKLPHLRF